MPNLLQQRLPVPAAAASSHDHGLLDDIEDLGLDDGFDRGARALPAMVGRHAATPAAGAAKQPQRAAAAATQDQSAALTGGASMAALNPVVGLGVDGGGGAGGERVPGTEAIWVKTFG